MIFIYTDEDKATVSKPIETMNQLDVISKKSFTKDDNTEIEQEKGNNVYFVKVDESVL